MTGLLRVTKVVGMEEVQVDKAESDFKKLSSQEIPTWRLRGQQKLPLGYPISVTTLALSYLKWSQLFGWGIGKKKKEAKRSGFQIVWLLKKDN